MGGIIISIRTKREEKMMKVGAVGCWLLPVVKLNPLQGFPLSLTLAVVIGWIVVVVH